MSTRMSPILPLLALLSTASSQCSAPKPASTVTIKGHTLTVEHFRKDPQRRSAPTWHSMLADGKAFLCSWDRDRYLHFHSENSEGGYDVAFLGASGKILEIQPLARRSEKGIMSGVEARRALFLPDGWAKKNGVTAGDSAEFSADIASADVEPMPAVRINGHTVHVETSHTTELRARGLMHRPRLSEHDGMLFMYPKEEQGVSYWMKNTLLALDIAHFNAKGELLNVCSRQPAPDPEEGGSISAPASGPAQFVLEVNFGWFRKQNLVDEEGKPTKRVVMELPEAIRAMARKADPR
ncbi:MAG: DUF192 domain-containing protein [Planctomycetes bacterium]|nr:DUF192 domain-containing protein [Planctomycetota bacterium]